MGGDEAMIVFVSACLLGENCKYNGGNNAVEGLLDQLTEHGFQVLGFCPECAGGLPTPRVPAERLGDRVVNKRGEDVTEAFWMGARAAVEAAKARGCTCAVLKRNSPSCGCGTIYDGSFTGTLTEGNGVTAQLMLEAGIAVYHEKNWMDLLPNE